MRGAKSWEENSVDGKMVLVETGYVRCTPKCSLVRRDRGEDTWGGEYTCTQRKP